MPPLGGLFGVDVQVDLGAGIEFFERDPDNPGESVRVDLRFAMQNLAGDGERQFDDFAFDAVIVVLPFAGKLAESRADLLALFGEGSVQFRAELLLCALAALLEKFSLLTAAAFLRALAPIGRIARRTARQSGVGIVV